MVNVASLTETLSNIKIPETLTPKAPFVAGGEKKKIIPALIPDGLKKGEARPVIEKIAAVELPKETATPVAEPVVEQPAAETKPPEQAKQPDTATTEAKILQEREIVKTQLKEVGTLLLHDRDTRAPLVSLALSASDTPIGDTFRKQTLLTILSGNNARSVSENDWEALQIKAPKMTDTDTKPLKTFFIDHGYAKEDVDSPNANLAAEAQRTINQVNEKGKPTQTAKDMQRALGWTTDHPMPSSPQDLASYINKDPESIDDMKKICTKEQLSEGLVRLQKTLQSMKGGAPTTIMFALMASNFFTQMIAEADAPPRGGMGH